MSCLFWYKAESGQSDQCLEMLTCLLWSNYNSPLGWYNTVVKLSLQNKVDLPFTKKNVYWCDMCEFKQESMKMQFCSSVGLP